MRPQLRRVARIGVFVAVSGMAASIARPADDIKIISVPANDAIWDAGTQRIYASVPGSAGPALGNTITAIDPYSGAVGPSVFVGSEPNKLAISQDGQFLYVGLDGAAAIRRFNLRTQTAEIQIQVGAGLRAKMIAVDPGNSHTIAVSRTSATSLSSGVGVAVFDDAVQRPLTTVRCYCGAIAFSQSGSRLYAYNNETTLHDFSRLSVDESGVRTVDATYGLISGLGDIVFEAGRIYGPNGRVIDPEARQIIATYPNVSGPVRPDAATGRTFSVSADATITSFDQATFVPMGTLRVVPATSTPQVPSRLIRWGEDGLAFAWKGKVYVARTSLVPASSAPMIPAAMLTLNATTFRSGDTMTAAPAVSAGQLPSRFDVYAVMQTPGGTFYSVVSGGRAAPGVAPMASALTAGPATFTPFVYRFTGEEPAGTYTWLTVITVAGTLTVVGRIDQQTFTVTR